MQVLTRWISSVLVGVIGMGGCASTPWPQFTTPEEHYQPILERQKAGLPIEDDPAPAIPQFTREEYEQRGDAQARQGQLVLAAVQYEKALEMDPAHIATRYKVAQLYLEHGNAEKAYDHFHRILDYAFEYVPAYIGMGRALLRLHRDQEAKLEFEQALVLDPTRWDAENYLGIIADRQGQHDQAARHYSRALARHPNDPAIVNNLGMAYMLSGQYEQAAQMFQQAARSGRSTQKIWNNLGLTYAKLARFRDAFEAFERGVGAAKAYNNLGVMFLESGQPVRAWRCFHRAVHSQPNFYEKAQENLELAQQQLARLPLLQRRAREQRAPSCL